MSLAALESRDTRPLAQAWPGIVAWVAGWIALFAADGRIDLANQAMLLVLACAVASPWLPEWASLATNAAAVLAFNWAFVPPRGTFTIDLREHALLLAAMLVVNAIVTALMSALRRQAALARRHAGYAEQLRAWGDTLRDTSDARAQVGALHEALRELGGGSAAVLALEDAMPADNDERAVLTVGDVHGDRGAALWHCLRQGQPIGPGTGRYEDLEDLYLPLRGRGACLGAAVIPEASGLRATDLRAHAQALCDALGLALQRAAARRDEQRSREQAQAQGVRNALLAAISHDYRTPLATIMGAASSLDEQAERLSVEQRRRLAHTIVEETALLGRMTDNTLQLARLDAPGVSLTCDWESAEEIVGTALRHARRPDDTARRVKARLEPDLPLLWCDALLVGQLLDNLVDNALKYSPPQSPIEIDVRRKDACVVLAVRDQGPGVAPAWRERVFEVFQRGAEPMSDAVAAPALASARPGAGVGLAVCRAIARAHGGELRLLPRPHGGCSFEFELPLRPVPAASAEAPGAS